MGHSPQPLVLREADLRAPVRRLLGSAHAVVTDWTVRPLWGGRGEVTGGVYRVAGHGRDQGQPMSWSLVLKVVSDPGGRDDPTAHNYWKREFLTYQAVLG